MTERFTYPSHTIFDVTIYPQNIDYLGNIVTDLARAGEHAQWSVTPTDASSRQIQIQLRGTYRNLLDTITQMFDHPGMFTGEEPLKSHEAILAANAVMVTARRVVTIHEEIA
jgi:hypothetical protein